MFQLQCIFGMGQNHLSEPQFKRRKLCDDRVLEVNAELIFKPDNRVLEPHLMVTYTAIHFTCNALPVPSSELLSRPKMISSAFFKTCNALKTVLSALCQQSLLDTRRPGTVEPISRQLELFTNYRAVYILCRKPQPTLFLFRMSTVESRNIFSHRIHGASLLIGLKMTTRRNFELDLTYSN